MPILPPGYHGMVCVICCAWNTGWLKSNWVFWKILVFRNTLYMHALIPRGGLLFHLSWPRLLHEFQLNAIQGLFCIKKDIFLGGWALHQVHRHLTFHIILSTPPLESSRRPTIYAACKISLPHIMLLLARAAHNLDDPNFRESPEILHFYYSSQKSLHAIRYESHQEEKLVCQVTTILLGQVQLNKCLTCQSFMSRNFIWNSTRVWVLEKRTYLQSKSKKKVRLDKWIDESIFLRTVAALDSFLFVYLGHDMACCQLSFKYSHTCWSRFQEWVGVSLAINEMLSLV